MSDTELDRLRRALSAEQFRCSGWQARALADEAALIDVRAELAQSRTDVMRLTALLGQGLDLIDTVLVAESPALPGGRFLEALRQALTVAPGEQLQAVSNG